MTREPPSRRPARSRALLVLLVLPCLALALAGCSIYQDQIQVPGTGQRLVVGGSIVFLGPLPKIWVIEGDRRELVELVREEAR